MSSERITKTRASLFLFLVGTLAFSMSSLPGPKNQISKESIDLSSETASVAQQLDQNGSANATVSTADYTGDVSVQRQKVFNGDEALIISGNVHCKGGENCDPNISEPIYAHLPPTASLKEVTDRISTEFAASANSLKAKNDQVEAERKRQELQKERAEQCLDKKDGEERTSCQADKFASMKSDKKAADYFENNIRDRLENLLSSDNKADQQRGVALMKQLAKSGRGGQFVKEELNDLGWYGYYKIQESDLKTQIVRMNAQALAMPMGDPRRQQYLTAISNLRNQGLGYQYAADSYFGNRIGAVGSEQFPTGGPFDYASQLTGDLGGFQYNLDQYYAGILQQQAQALGLNGTTVNGDPRNLRNGGTLFGNTAGNSAFRPQVTATTPFAQNTLQQPVGTQSTGVAPQSVSGAPATGLQGQSSTIPHLGAAVTKR